MANKNYITKLLKTILDKIEKEKSNLLGEGTGTIAKLIISEESLSTADPLQEYEFDKLFQDEIKPGEPLEFIDIPDDFDWEVLFNL